MKYSYFMLINYQLSSAVHNMEIWGPPELLVQYVRPNSDCFTDFYAGSVPSSGRSIKNAEYWEG